MRFTTESLSRCDTYENKFRTYAEEPKLREARKLAACQDVLETDSARLERTMMERMSKGIFRQEGVPVEFVQKVGKFIFVAVLFPPYLIAYAAPKWVFQYALPFVADLTSNYLTKLAGGFASLSAWVIQISGTVLEKFNFSFLKRLKMPEKALKASKDLIKQAFSKINALLSSLYKKMTSPVVRFGKKVKEAIQVRYHRAEEKVSNWLSAIVKWLSSKIPSFNFSWKIKLPDGHRIKHKLAQPGLKVMAWGKSLYENKDEYLQKCIRFIKAFKVLGRVPVVLAQFFWAILKTNYQSWIEPYIQWVMPLCRWIKRKVVARVARVVKFSKRVNASLTRVSDRISNGVKNLGEALVNLKNKIVAPFVRIQKKAIKVSAVISSGISKLNDKIVIKAAQLKNMTVNISKKVLQFIKSSVKYVMALPKRSFDALTRLGDRMVKGGLWVSQKSKEAYFFTKVAIRLGFRYLQSII